MEETKHMVLVDNRDRVDTSSSPFDFVVDFPSLGLQPFKNVTSVALKGVGFPKVMNEDYVLIDIEELNGGTSFVTSATNLGSGIFGSMYFDSSALNPGDVRPKFGTEVYSDPIPFQPALSQLSKLRIKFRKQSGAIVTTADTAGVDRASLVLGIVTRPRTCY